MQIQYQFNRCMNYMIKPQCSAIYLFYKMIILSEKASNLFSVAVQQIEEKGSLQGLPEDFINFLVDRKIVILKKNS